MLFFEQYSPILIMIALHKMQVPPGAVRRIFSLASGHEVFSVKELLNSPGSGFACSSGEAYKGCGGIVEASYLVDAKNRTHAANRSAILQSPLGKDYSVKREEQRSYAMSGTRVIRVFTNGMVDQPGHKMVLDKRSAPTYERVLENVGKTITIAGGVKKLYTLPDLHLVKGLPELFKYSNYLAVGTAQLDRTQLPSLAKPSTAIPGSTKTALPGPAKKKAGKYTPHTGRKSLKPVSGVSGSDDGDVLNPHSALPSIESRAGAVLDASNNSDSLYDTERDRQRRAHQERMALRQRQRQNNQAVKVDNIADGAEVLELKIDDERQRQQAEFRRKMNQRVASARRSDPNSQEQAATKIQATYRGHRTRKKLMDDLAKGKRPGIHRRCPPKKRPGEKETETDKLLRIERIPTPDLTVNPAEVLRLKEAAAVKIQASYRGHKDRKAYPVPLRLVRLEKEQLAKAKAALAAKADIDALVQSASAKTTPSSVPTERSSSGGDEPVKVKTGKHGKLLKPKKEKKSKMEKRLKKGTSSNTATPDTTVSEEHTVATKLERQTSKFSTRGIEDKRLVEQNYEIGKDLGDGNFAVVKECVHKVTGKKYALKVIDKAKTEGAKETKMIENEVKTMRSLNHPNCVGLYDVYDTKSELYLVMEHVTGGDLFDRIVARGKYPEAEARVVVKAMATAINHMHEKNIIHRDLKPENLLVATDKNGLDTIKLADFGLSMVVTEPLNTICGTPTYVAPEIISEAPEGYGLPVDMWAIGIISYIILCGFPPFATANKSQKDLFRKIRSGKFSFPKPYWDDISEDAKSMISGLLMVDPETRLTAKQLLQHPWFKGQSGNGTAIDLTKN